VTTRKQRAHDTERAVAQWFRENGWPYAEPVGAGRDGSDVTGIPGLCVEVKARRDLNLPQWLRQHSNSLADGDAQAWQLPLVVHRPDGYGPARIAEWPVTMRLDDFTALLHEAGYGSANVETGMGQGRARDGGQGQTTPEGR
jgi:hypothetical protein